VDASVSTDTNHPPALDDYERVDQKTGTCSLTLGKAEARA
jgi:hypothetical protein